jgi:Domain of unknown function (DUF222)/HNH endonuclease
MDSALGGGWLSQWDRPQADGTWASPFAVEVDEQWPKGAPEATITDAMLCFAEGLHEAERALLGFIHSWSKSGEWSEHGCLSPAAFLSNSLGISHSEAQRKLRLADGLATWPLLHEAIHQGNSLSISQAELLLRVATDPRAALFERDLELLIGHAATLNIAQFARVLKHWAALADNHITSQPDPDDDINHGDQASTPAEVPSRLHVAATLDDRVEVSGSLDTVDGLIVRAAIDAALRLNHPSETDFETGEGTVPHEAGLSVAAKVPTDVRPESVRNAEALTIIASFFLEHHAKVTGTGSVTNLDVRIDLEVLNGQRGGLAEVGPRNTCVPLNEALALCCNSTVTRIVSAGDSLVLDVGRATRVIAPKLEKAIRHRDQFCRFPGCHMPGAFTDVHHVVWWSRGGETNRDNLALMCRRHHRMIHNNWTVTGNPNAILTFTNPNGRNFTTKPPPTIGALIT